MASDIDYEAAFTNALSEPTEGEQASDEQSVDPLLNDGPEEDESEELQEEVDEGDGEYESDDSGDEDVAEGPSEAMLAVARIQGVPEELLSIARSDDDVSKLLSYAKLSADRTEEEPQEEPAQEEPEFTVSSFISEEDFDQSDPAHVALKKVVEALSEERKTNRLLLAHASQQLHQQQQQEAMKFQAPYDEALDELESPMFGNASKGLTQSQIEARKQAFKGYMSLVDGEPEDRRKELAQAAVKLKFSKAFPESPDVDRRKALAKQSRKRRGAGGSKAPPEKLSPVEEFEKRLLAMGTR